ncbi:MAG: hypothetical protein U0V75_03710 [Ferruginibacter sp.]
MKKIAGALVFVAAFAATVTAQTPRTLKKVMELKMPKTAEDDMPGTRGASVVWHPVQKKYYASFAGNIGYPMAVFNVAGKRLSGDETTTQVDTRGLWYDPVKKQVCGNAFSEYGWFSYKINTTGLVGDVKIDLEGKHQPGDQSVGAYNIAKKQVIFLSGSEIWSYNADGTEAENKTTLHWGLTAKDGIAEDEDVTETPEGYNNTTAVYTGLPNAEIGVLNIVDKQIELYNIKTGFLSKKLKLPEDAPAEASFNFSYTNGMFWLFDMEGRKWICFK